MPSTPGVGHSSYTTQKQSDFRTIIAKHTDIVRNMVWKHRFIHPTYFYYDLTAGPGYHASYGDGSPIIFMQEAEKQHLDYSAVFIERDGILAETLKKNTVGFAKGYHRVINCDCEELNGKFLAEYDHVYEAHGRRVFAGLVYCDANGIPPFDLLSHWSNQKWAGMIDIMVHLPATVIKRCFGVHGKKLEDYLSSINKKFWLIRKPVGKWQWTFLVGTNWKDFPKFVDQGFVRLNSKEGQEYFQRMNLSASERPEQPYKTYREYLKHPKFLEIRSQVMERAGGVCEKCGSAPATEPHHLKYPPWGTFDVPENLVAVCHDCHCILHDIDPATERRRTRK